MCKCVYCQAENSKLISDYIRWFLLIWLSIFHFTNAVIVHSLMFCVSFSPSLLFSYHFSSSLSLSLHLFSIYSILDAVLDLAWDSHSIGAMLSAFCLHACARPFCMYTIIQHQSPVTLCNLGVGATFGESILHDLPRDSTVVTKTTCELLRVEQQDFRLIWEVSEYVYVPMSIY